MDDGVFYGMLDHTKMALCMCVLTVAFISPFGAIVGSNSFQDSHPTSVGSRTILNANGELSQ